MHFKRHGDCLDGRGGPHAMRPAFATFISRVVWGRARMARFLIFHIHRSPRCISFHQRPRILLTVRVTHNWLTVFVAIALRRLQHRPELVDLDVQPALAICSLVHQSWPQSRRLQMLVPCQQRRPMDSFRETPSALIFPLYRTRVILY